MADKTPRLPSLDHPITITANPDPVVIRIGGQVVASTVNALTLREAAYPPVQYIPRQDVDFSRLTRTAHASYCPYKGDAAYYSITGIPRGENAVWSYENPYPAVARIAGHLAFYADRVDPAA